MSNIVKAALANYKELEPDSPDSTVWQIRHDIDEALEHAKLTDKEKGIIAAKFLVDPNPPTRDRINKHGGTSGRPPGGTTIQQIASEFINADKSDNAKNIEASRAITSAAEKIANYLGKEYQDNASAVRGS